MRAAVVQLNSDADVEANVARAERQVRAAAAAGAELVALPEKWSLLGPGDALRDGAQPLDGPVVGAASGWARDLGVWLLAGSITERIEGELPANTSLLIDPDGRIVATYRKVHMFDVEVEGVSYRESDHEQAGADLAMHPCGPLELGLTVCYDVRFPELYRLYAEAGATAVTVPAAFTAPTGKAHWEVLLRARAIENQFFVLAPNQFGAAPPQYESWGHSLIADPWGRVLAICEEGEGFAVTDLDLDELERIRREVPSLANRRPDAYRPPRTEGSHV